MLYGFIQAVAPLIFKLLWGLKINHRERMPGEGPVILVANHKSYLDPLVVGITAGRRKVFFLAKYELFEIPLFSWLIRRLNAFPVRRGVADRSALKKSIALLSEGKVLCLFPEGTRHRDGSIGEIMPGAGLLAKKTGASIVPIFIKGTENVLKGKIPRFPRLEATFGEPIEPQVGLGEKTDLSLLIKRRLEELAG